MNPKIYIIDNKKISLTDYEWEMYQAICRSYDRPNFKGEELFKELFETDESGIIVCLKPPTRFTSIEIFLFIVSIYEHQHVRQMYQYVHNLAEEVKSKLDKLEINKSDTKE